MDGRTDQYALACVAYQLLTGAVPFERDQGMAVLLAHLSAPPPSLGSRRPGLPGAADQVLARAMAKVPEKRYGSCRDFADALREALGLAPYHSRGPASASDHPQPQMTAQPRFHTPAAAKTRKATSPADPATAATVDSVPGDESPAAAAVIVTSPARPGTSEAVPPSAPAVPDEGIPADAATATAARLATEAAGEPGGGLPKEPGNPKADTKRPPGAANVFTAGQHARSDPGPGDDRAQPARRPRRRFLAIALGCAVLAVAGVLPLVLASSPRSPSHSSVAARTLAANLTDPGGVDVTAVAFSPNGTLAAGDSSGSIYLWNVAAKSLAATLTDPDTNKVSSVAFSPDGATLAVCDGSGGIYLWNVATKSLAATLTAPGGVGVSSVAFSPNGMTLAAVGGGVYLWNVATKSLTTTLTGPSAGNIGGNLNSVAFSPNGTTLAAAGDNNNTYLWNVAAKNSPATLTDPDGLGAYSVAFSPDGTTLAAVDGNGSIYLWNVATESLTTSLTDPGAENISVGVYSVAFSPDGTTLAAVDGNGSIYLWNVATESLTTTLTDPGAGHISGNLNSVAFSPDGTTLAAGDSNGITHTWPTGSYLSSATVEPDVAIQPE